MANKPTNTLANRPRFSAAIKSDAYQKLINSTLGDEKRASKFIASISSAVAVNPALQECDAGTILSAALLGESLELSPSPQLGHFYIVPYNDKMRGKVGTFQIGYKGYVQLAIRSGQYRNINAISVKEGELKRWNPLTEKIELELIEDEVTREKTKTIGYVAYFELTNGFSKTIYWSKEKMTKHAKTYSKAYGTQYSFWTKDFDEMAYKTLIRQLISKWGVMSIDFQRAYQNDMATVDLEDGLPNYVDNDPNNEPEGTGEEENPEQPTKQRSLLEDEG